MIEERIMTSKCRRILDEYGDVLKEIIESELNNLGRTSMNGETEFEIVKKVFTIEGTKEGLRKILQKINEYASKQI